MRRFEYKWVNRGSIANAEDWPVESIKVTEWMNGLGADGWELVDILVNSYGIRLILKREIIT